MTEKHTRIVGGERFIWYTERLWEHASTLNPFEVTIDEIPEVDLDCWFETRTPTIREVAKHAARIAEADLRYPVILNADGALMDGGHRICKALVNGQTTVAAVRFDETPEPDVRVSLDG